MYETTTHLLSSLKTFLNFVDDEKLLRVCLIDQCFVEESNENDEIEDSSVY